MVKEILHIRARLVLAITVIIAVIFTQIIPMINVTAQTDDEKAVAHLQQLYKEYVTEYGDTTTKEGLSRIYSQALSVNGDSFAAEKAAGYSVELNAAVLRPVDGSKDKDGTITPARDGYAVIKAVVKKSGNEVGRVELTEPIKAEVKTLTYQKSSTDENGGTFKRGGNGGIYLDYYEGTADKLIIPEGVEEINYTNRKTWYRGDKESVKIIIFPSTMKKMIAETLSEFTNLQAVYIPDGCTVFGENVFWGCHSLRYVRLPDDLETIAKKTFFNCYALTQLYIPSSVKNIKDAAFQNSAIRDVVLTNENLIGEGYDTYKGVLTEESSNTSRDVRRDVKRDLSDDTKNISKRNFYVLGENAKVNSSWKWFTSVGMVADKNYIHAYSISGTELDVTALGSQSADFTNRYTALDSEISEELVELYNSYMKNGRYPTEISETDINDIIGALELTNDTTENDLKNAFSTALEDTGYVVKIEDLKKISAVGGCKDESGIIFEGYNGYIYATAVFSAVNKEISFPIGGVIKPEIEEYSFAKTAIATEFSKANVDGKNGYKGITEGNEYFFIADDGVTLLAYSGNAEKIVIPEGIEYLDASWWLDTDLAAVRCIVLPASLKALPDQFAVPFSGNIEVIVMGDNVTKAEGKHTFRKCYRLKHLRLSENLENLTEEALFQTLLLTELHLPNGLKRIEQGALHLAAVRDIVIPAGVEYIASEAFAWPLRKLDYLSAENRPQGNAVNNEVIAELEPIFAQRVCDATGSMRPRNIIFLNKENEFGTKQDYWNSHASWVSVNVGYISGSSVEKIVEDGYADGDIYSYSLIDMSQNTVKAMLASALDRVPIGEETTEDDILSFAKSVIYTSRLNDDMKISDFSLVKATAENDGIASGIITVTEKEGNSPITIALNRIINYKAAYTVKNDGSQWEEIIDKYANNFIPNITVFSDEAFEDTVIDSVAPSETTPDESIVEKEETTKEIVVQKEIVKKIKKKRVNKAEASPLLIIGVSAGAVIAAAAIITAVIIILKRKKKIH